jgi:hypothetical protein
MALRGESIGSLETGASQETVKKIGKRSAGAGWCRALVALVAAGTILSLLGDATRANAVDTSNEQILIGLITKTSQSVFREVAPSRDGSSREARSEASRSVRQIRRR